jgi:hypothetical protein
LAEVSNPHRWSGRDGRVTAAVSALGQKHTCAHVLSSKYCFAPVAGEFVVETRADNMGCQGEIVSQSNVGKSGLPPTSVPVAVYRAKICTEILELRRPTLAERVLDSAPDGPARSGGRGTCSLAFRKGRDDTRFWYGLRAGLGDCRFGSKAGIRRYALFFWTNTW